MAPASGAPCIVWFRDDLRLSDHPALHEAAGAGSPVICLYILDETLPLPARPLGAAARWWLARSLRSLEQSLDAIGARLVLRRGPAAQIIADLAQETGAETVFWNEIAYEPYETQANQVALRLEAIGVGSQRFPGDLLVAPARIRNKEGRGLRVFTPFWKRVQALGAPRQPLPAPKALKPGPWTRGRQTRGLAS
jgi:deoxyribodipyrimidine photo-lyase